MELAGISVGLVSLFSTCMDALDKLETWKAFSQESRQFHSILEADKRRFQEWAQAVGISAENEKLRDVHHPRLDDPAVVESVKIVLYSLCETLGAADRAGSRFRLKPRDIEDEIQQTPTLPMKSTGSEVQPQLSIRSKLDWTFRQRGRFVGQVEMFQKLLERLHNLVPPINHEVKKYEHIDTPLASDVQQLLEETKNATRIQTLKNVDEWLDCKSSDRQYDDLLEARLGGTCEWIFNDPTFKKWIQHSSTTDSRLLWIHGGAGHGKSVLCAKIIQHLQLSNDSDPPIFFFSSAHQGTEQQPKDIVRAWLSMFARLVDDAIFTIRGYMSKADAGSRASQPVVWQILEELLRNERERILVLDGLDEYDQRNDNRALFLENLKNRLRSMGTRVLVVTRDEVDIRRELQPGSNFSAGWTFFDCHLSESNLRPDIAQFSQHVIRRKLPNKGQTLQQELADQMTNKCQGMFLWIKMQEGQLEGYRNRKQLQDVIRKMPVGLTQVYERNWTAIHHQDYVDLNRAMAILRWVVFAARPLTVLELTDALLDLDSDCGKLPLDELPDSIDQEYINGAIKGICKSLVDVRAPKENEAVGNSTVGLIHFSVKEFLLSVLPTPTTLPTPILPKFIDTGCHHHHNTILAENCLRYLSYPQTWETYASPKTTRLRPFVDYASRFWPTHYKSSGKTSQRLLENFFRKDNLGFHQWGAHVESIYSSSVAYKHSSPLYYLALLDLLSEVKLPSEYITEDLNQADGRYGSPLSVACLHGNYSAFNHLLQLGANIDIKGGLSGSALNAAVNMGHENMATKLLSLGASISLKSTNGMTPLSFACKSDNTKLVQLLIAQGADLQNRNNDGIAPLHIACDSERIDIFQLLLDAGADPDIQTNDKSTALHLACNEGSVVLVKLLLHKAASLDALNSYGQTALHYATWKGNQQIVQLLVSRGARLAVVDKDGWTPLIMAAHHGHTGIMKCILDKNADLVSVGNDQGWAPLHSACRAGQLQAIQLLLERGANIDTPDDSGWTSLHSACKKGQPEVVELLLSRGADPGFRSEDGQTPLHSASHQGHLQIIQLLLEHSAERSMADKEKGIPLHSASGMENCETVSPLLGRGFDMAAADNYGYTALHFACEMGHDEAALLLLEHGANVVSQSNNGPTPLRLASTNGHLKCVQLLSSRSADLNGQNIHGETPLIAACEEGHLEIVKLLLDSGANLDLKDNYGRGILSHAAVNGHRSILEFLLEKYTEDGSRKNVTDGTTAKEAPTLTKGIHPDQRDHFGSTPLSLAARNSHSSIVKLLLTIGCVEVRSQDSLGRTPLSWARQHGHKIIEQMLLQDNEKPCQSSPEVVEMLDEMTINVGKTLGWCDICTLCVQEGSTYHQCDICSGGDFWICAECYDLGGRCFISEHSLILKKAKVV